MNAIQGAKRKQDQVAKIFQPENLLFIFLVVIKNFTELLDKTNLCTFSRNGSTCQSHMQECP